MASVEQVEEEKFQEDESWINTVKVMQENKVILICNGGEVEADSVTLAARSPYFERMLNTDFKESSTKQFEFSYFKKDIMIMILSFIYKSDASVRSNIRHDRLIQMYELSNLFEVSWLKDFFWVQILQRKMNTNDWFSIWELVLLNGSDRDICKLLYFILENISKIVEKNFYTLTYSQINQLMDKINQNKISIEEDFLEAIIQWSQKTNQPKRHLQSMLLQMNFDLISTETLSHLWEKEDLFDDEFFKECFKLNISLGLKTKFQQFALKLFFFRLYRKVTSPEVSEGRLEIFDSEKNFCKMIKNPPFRFNADIVPVQCGEDLYIIGSIPNGSPDTSIRKSFFLYDWKKNRIHMKPSLLKEVKNPVTCASENNIYVMERNSSKVIQYFSITENKWFAKECEDLDVKACVAFKDDVYFIYDKNNGHYLTSLKKRSLSDISNQYCNFMDPRVPKYFFIHQNSVIVYRDKIFVIMHHWSSVSRYYEWHIFDPLAQNWDIKKICMPPLCRAGIRRCFAKQFIIFFNEDEDDRALYRFHANNMNVRKIMAVSESVDDYWKSLDDHEKSLDDHEKSLDDPEKPRYRFQTEIPFIFL